MDELLYLSSSLFKNFWMNRDSWQMQVYFRTYLHEHSTWRASSWIGSMIADFKISFSFPGFLFQSISFGYLRLSSTHLVNAVNLHLVNDSSRVFLVLIPFPYHSILISYFFISSLTRETWMRRRETGLLPFPWLLSIYFQRWSQNVVTSFAQGGSLLHIISFRFVGVNGVGVLAEVWRRELAGSREKVIPSSAEEDYSHYFMISSRANTLVLVHCQGTS